MDKVLKGIPLIKNFFLNKKRSISFTLLLLLLFFPVFPYDFSSKLLISFSLISIIFYWKEGLYNLKKLKNRYLAYNLLFVFICLITLFYSTDFGAGIKNIKTLIPIVIMPLVIIYFQRKYSKNDFLLLQVVFILSNVLFFIFLMLYFLQYSVEHCFYDISALTLFEKFTYIWNEPYSKLLWCAEQKKESFFLIHKTYNSINILIACLFIVDVFFKRKNTYLVKTLLFLAFVLFSLLIVYFKSVSGLFLLCTILPCVFFSNMYKIKKTIILGLLFIFGVIVVIKKQSIINQFNKQRIDNIYRGDLGGLYERYYLNITSSQLILESPVIGYGIGDVQDKLNTQYLINSETDGIYLNFSNLNSHNYYLYVVLIGGPLLLMAFVLMILNNFKLAIKNKEKYYLSFLIIIFLCLFFENLFSRMTGVLTYSIINSFFIKSIIDEK